MIFSTSDYLTLAQSQTRAESLSPKVTYFAFISRLDSVYFRTICSGLLTSRNPLAASFRLSVSFLDKCERTDGMAKRIYVGNLPWATTSDDLRDMFSQHGEVESAEVISDRETGRSRGFGFVAMTSDEATAKAIEALNGHDLDGRPLVVNEARERQPRSGGYRR